MGPPWVDRTRHSQEEFSQWAKGLVEVSVSPGAAGVREATPPHRFFLSSVNQTLVETVTESPGISRSSEDPGKKAAGTREQGPEVHLSLPLHVRQRHSNTG